jgi:hypothetical protein
MSPGHWTSYLHALLSSVHVVGPRSPSTSFPIASAAPTRDACSCVGVAATEHVRVVASSAHIVSAACVGLDPANSACRSIKLSSALTRSVGVVPATSDRRRDAARVASALASTCVSAAPACMSLNVRSSHQPVFVRLNPSCVTCMVPSFVRPSVIRDLAAAIAAGVVGLGLVRARLLGHEIRHDHKEASVLEWTSAQFLFCTSRCWDVKSG